MAAFLGTTTALLGMLLASRLPPAAHGLRIVSAVVLATSWAPAVADLAGRRRLAAALFALPIAFGAPLVMTRVLPELEPWLGARDVAEAMAANSPARASLVLVEPAPPSLRLLTRRNLVFASGPVAALEAAPSHAATDGFVYLALPGARSLEALQRASSHVEVLARTPLLTLVRARPAANATQPGTGRTAAPGGP
jgi:hypothetical protein